MSITERYVSISRKIATAAAVSGRKSEEIEFLAVSKTQPIEQIQALYQIGHRDFAENYVQELELKAKQAQELGMKDIRWHMIGHLQTNKINRVLPVVHAIQTLDRAKLIEGVGQKLTRPLRAWIEVNIDSESDKSGAQLSEVPALLELSKKFKNLDVIGLMAIPNPQNQDQDQLNSLARLKTQARSCGLTQISWGMSQDFESAIHNGSTCVRIGTSLFGERKSGGNA